MSNEAQGPMNPTSWNEAERYFAGLLVGRDAGLEGALGASAAAGLPGIQVSAVEGKLLYLLARMIRARRILEIGTLGGYSTIWLARALPADGVVVTLELDEGHAAVARENAQRAGVGKNVEVIVGAALETLPALAGRGPFDLIFIDADKANYPAYLEWSLRLSRVGTVIVADNVVRKGAVVDADSADPGVQGVRRFVEMLSTEARVTATVLQTVGSKGYDGLAVALVTGE